MVAAPQSDAPAHTEVRGSDPVEALIRLGGVATAQELRAVCMPRPIRAALDGGRVIRPGPRQYALPVVPEAFVAAARVGGVVGGLSAALHWGWKVKTPPRRPRIICPRGRKRSKEVREGVDIWWDGVAEEDLHAGRVTTPRRTLLDCMRRLPYDEALCVADSALRSGLPRSLLVEAAEASPRTGRPQALRVARAADARAANPFESCLRAICHGVEDLSVEPQLLVEDIGHADLVDPRLRIAIEADSWEHHSLPEPFRYDVRRYTAMVRHRWRVVRFVWEDVMHRQDYVAAVLADLVAQGEPIYGQLVAPGRDSRLNPEP